MEVKVKTKQQQKTIETFFKSSPYTGLDINNSGNCESLHQLHAQVKKKRKRKSLDRLYFWEVTIEVKT